MCRYSYVSGACANRRVDSIHCIGESECEFSGMNLLGPSRDLDDGHDSLAEEWHQLFCETHGRFLCTRKKDCAAPMNVGRSVSYRQRKLVDDGQETW
ncbi:MAG: hypothetical protein OEM29_07395 [Thermoplasmata archaeon]|nr:hypothetical protein [Thermoplasmata archaeon]